MKNILSNTIFTFHKINSPGWFEGIINSLSSLFTFISAKDIEDFYYNNKKISNGCHLTFDDGERTFYDVVFPILKKHNIPSSIYVLPPVIKTGINTWPQEIAGYDHNILKDIIVKEKNWKKNEIYAYPILPLLKSLTIKEVWTIISKYQAQQAVFPKPSQNLSISELLELKSNGLVTIGAHSMTHPILKNETDNIAEFEIKNSVDELSEILGEKVIFFAYPNGEPGVDFTEREIKILKNAGIKIAFSTQYKKFTMNDNPLSIPRKVLCNGSKKFLYFELFTGFNWDKLEKIKKGTSEREQRKKLNEILSI